MADHSECKKMNEADDVSGTKGELSALINHASCRFHWQNTLSIDTNKVFLIPSYSKEPIELTRNVALEFIQFYSKELQVPCGYHSGFLLVNNEKQVLENIQVKNYMFEIDLYIKDDMIDKNQDLEQNKHETNMKKQCDENQALVTPSPTIEPHETKAVISKPETVSPTIEVTLGYIPGHCNEHLNSTSVLNIEQPRHNEILPTIPNSSNVVDDVLGGKIDDKHSRGKQAGDTAMCSSQKIPHYSFVIPADQESVHSKGVNSQLTKSTDSTNISSCQSLLKDQNFENQLHFCRSPSSSLCQDIPLPLSFSSVSHTSSVDNLLSSENVALHVISLQNYSDNPRLNDENCSERPKFSEFPPEERASSSMSLPVRFSPSLQYKDFQVIHSMPSTITGGSNTSPVDANPPPACDNASLNHKFGGSHPALRSPLITGRSRTLRHSTPTSSYSTEPHESGTPMEAKSYSPTKNLHQTAETNAAQTNNLLPEMSNFDNNQHLVGQLELLRGINESFRAELILLRQLHHNYTTNPQSAPSPTPGTTQDSMSNLVSHLKEEKQTLQNEVEKLKEELRQYKHLAAYSQNTPLHSDSPALSPSQEKGNVYHCEELVLRRRIADLQHQVSQHLESNLSLSAQLVAAQTRISQLEFDNHKLNEQIENKEKQADNKTVSKRPSQFVEEGDSFNVKSRSRPGDGHLEIETDSRFELVGASSVKDEKTSDPSRKQSRDMLLSKKHEILNKTEEDENIRPGVVVYPTSQPIAEETQTEKQVHPTSKKSRKSITQSKSVPRTKKGESRKETKSSNGNNPQEETKLVNNSNVNDFMSPRKTRWDQYNQIRLNKASIQSLQNSLDEQDMLRKAFLTQYKPKVCDPSRNSTDNWNSSYSRANSKERTGLKSAKSTIVPSTTSDSTSLLLAAPCLPQTCNQDFQCEDDTDTETDLLLRTGSLDRINPSSSVQRMDESWSHRRRMSIDSAGSSTLTNSDLEMSGSSSNHGTTKKRPKSAEFQGNSFSNRLREKSISREALKTMNGTRYTDSASGLDVDDIDKPKKMSCISSSKKIISGNEASKRQWMFTQGMQPYIPHSSDEIHIGDVVKFSKQSGKISQGVVKFIGPLYGRRDIYIGIELQKEEGKHDGVFEGRRYFHSKSNKGVFVTFNKIVMAWEPVH